MRDASATSRKARASVGGGVSATSRKARALEDDVASATSREARAQEDHGPSATSREARAEPESRNVPESEQTVTFIDLLTHGEVLGALGMVSGLPSWAMLAGLCRRAPRAQRLGAEACAEVKAEAKEEASPTSRKARAAEGPGGVDDHEPLWVREMFTVEQLEALDALDNAQRAAVLAKCALRVQEMEESRML